jgi:hypothetical protein
MLVAMVSRAIDIVCQGVTILVTSGHRNEQEREFIMADAERKDLNKADETRSFPHGKVDLVNMGGGTIGRLTLEPGWKWSVDVKPVAGTDWCEAPHFQYHLSGRIGILMEDGTEMEVGPGEVTSLPKGHDAWVVGNEPVVLIDWYGAVNYAKG